MTYEEEKVITDKLLKIFNSKEYTTCIKECLQLINNIDCTNIDNNELIWWLYFRIASCYRELAEYKKGIHYMHKAIRFSSFKYRIVQNYWNLAFMYGKVDKKKCIEYYEIAIQEACDADYKVHLVSLLSNKAFHTNDESLAYQAYDILNEITDESLQEFNRTRDQLHNVVYENLTDIYINTNHPLKARHAINQITNENIKSKLRNKMQQAYAVC